MHYTLPCFQVVYEDYEMIKLTAPYISGFLAFREVDFLVALFNKVKKNNPKYTPDVSINFTLLVQHKCFHPHNMYVFCLF